jgi:hypothetical protein
MESTATQWQQAARERAIKHFRVAWDRAPAAGRQALVEAAVRGRIGHRWETGAHACVLALLVRPALREREPVKAGAYRMFGCEVTEDLPVTWDAHGISAAQLLAAVGVDLPERGHRGIMGWLRARGRQAAAPAGVA